MGWVVRLIEMATAKPTRSVDVLEFGQPPDFSDIANLGLTLAEAKQLLGRVQRAVAAVQAHDHAVLRPNCSSCGAVSLHRLRSYRDCCQLAVALSVDPGAGPAARASFRPDVLSRRRRRPGTAPASGDRKETTTPCVATRSRSVSDCVTLPRSNRWRPRRRSPSPLTLPSFVAVTRANAIWRFASAMSRRPTVGGKWLCQRILAHFADEFWPTLRSGWRSYFSFRIGGFAAVRRAAVRLSRYDSLPVSMMWARSVNRSMSALQSRGLG